MNTKTILRIAGALVLVAAVVVALAVLPVKDYLAGFLEMRRWLSPPHRRKKALRTPVHTLTIVMPVESNEMRSVLEKPMTGAVEVLPGDIHNRLDLRRAERRLRHPRRTKGQEYDATTEARGTCTDSGDCR